ncbi:MAG: SMI1/KNR4 family protein [Leptolyngbya sp. SIO3F4]|nr:SMI1/KNR4 family protein [Leptolyngbya sp. SIO3F4]
MESLISSLEKIFDIWQQDREDLIELLQPGLKVQEIQERLANLPFKLSQEFHHLYQWRNGIQASTVYDFAFDFIPGYLFLPLADALKKYESIEEFKNSYTFLQDSNYHRPWFPVFSSDLGSFIVFGDENIHTSSPVFFLDWSSGDVIFECKYPNLTSMISVVAQCYESGAYYYETEVMDQFGTIVEFLKEDRQEVARIRRKYL